MKGERGGEPMRRGRGGAVCGTSKSKKNKKKKKGEGRTLISNELVWS